jgi:hypothetical protein
MSQYFSGISTNELYTKSLYVDGNQISQSIVNSSVASGLATKVDITTYNTNNNAIATAISAKQDILIAGTGLTKTGSTLSVNPSQSQITAVGTLTSLNVSGNVTTGGVQTPSNINAGLALGTTGNIVQSSAGACFTNASLGDIIIRNTSSNIRVGTSTGVSNLDIATTSGNVIINTTTDSTSSTTGALQVAGGVGIAKKLFVGDTMSSPMIICPPTTNAVPTLTTRSLGTKVVLYPSLSSSTVDYAIGVSNAGSLWSSVENTSAKFDWYGGTTVAASLSGSGILSLFNTIDSTSTTTGALQVSGGVGIAKNLNIGNLQINRGYDGDGNFLWNTFSSPGGGFVVKSAGVDFKCPVAVLTTTDSTSTTTGALTVYGGVGISKSVYVGTNIYATRLLGISSAAGTPNDLLYLGKSTIGNFFIDREAGQLILGYNTPKPTAGGGVFQIYNNSTDRVVLFEIITAGTSTGSNSVNISNLVVTTTTDSTSTTTGALQVSGGAGIAKNITAANYQTSSFLPNISQSSYNFGTPTQWGYARKDSNMVTINFLSSFTTTGSSSGQPLQFTAPFSCTHSRYHTQGHAEVRYAGSYVKLVPVSVGGSTTFTLQTEALADYTLIVGVAVVYCSLTYRWT